jgi:hypothetical protein
MLGEAEYAAREFYAIKNMVDQNIGRGAEINLTPVRQEIDMLDVLKKADPLVINFPVDAAPEIRQSLVKLMLFDKGVSSLSSNRLNPLQFLPEDIEYIMAMLVAMSGMEVAPSVRDNAKEVILATAAQKSEITMLDAVDAFDLEPELKEFSAALRKAALPGPFGRYFDNPLA